MQMSERDPAQTQKLLCLCDVPVQKEPKSS